MRWAFDYRIIDGLVGVERLGAIQRKSEIVFECWGYHLN